MAWMSHGVVLSRPAARYVGNAGPLLLIESVTAYVVHHKKVKSGYKSATTHTP